MGLLEPGQSLNPADSVLALCHLPLLGGGWSRQLQLTWDWPVTGVPLFSCSSPFSPSLYSVTVCQAPSLIWASLTMMATPVPQLNLQWRNKQEGKMLGLTNLLCFFIFLFDFLCRSEMLGNPAPTLSFSKTCSVYSEFQHCGFL